MLATHHLVHHLTTIGMKCILYRSVPSRQYNSIHNLSAFLFRKLPEVLIHCHQHLSFSSSTIHNNKSKSSKALSDVPLSNHKKLHAECRASEWVVRLGASVRSNVSSLTPKRIHRTGSHPHLLPSTPSKRRQAHGPMFPPVPADSTCKTNK